MKVPTAVSVLYVYGAFLMLGGLIAFAMSGFEARAKTAIIMGNDTAQLMRMNEQLEVNPTDSPEIVFVRCCCSGCGCGFVMWVCAWMGSHGRMAGPRLARGLSLVFLVLFLFRGYKIRDVEEKQYLFVTSDTHAHSTILIILRCR